MNRDKDAIIPLAQQLDSTINNIEKPSTSSNANLIEESLEPLCTDNPTPTSQEEPDHRNYWELSVNFSGPNNIAVVIHSPSALAIQESDAVVNNSWADLAEEEEDRSKAPPKSGKKIAKKPARNLKPRRGQNTKPSQ